jgi:glycosyltransferase involved in cell wall biosynthesis
MQTTKNIAIIGTVGVPAQYGGFETLTEHLIDKLSSDYDITVYCSGVTYKKKTRKSYYHNAKLVFIPLKANGIQSILYDAISIVHSLFYADVLLILGVSGAFILPFVKIFTNKKIIISIDGIEWKRDKWNFLAKSYLFWAEYIAVKYSHIDISDNESIQNYTGMRYGTLSKIIEYGGDHTVKQSPTLQDKKEYPFMKKTYAFSVCRIEPENNIHEILKAFSSIPKYILVFVGNWNNSEYGINLKNSFQDFENLILLDPIYDQKKLDLLRSNAMLYVHGHSAGGTNPSLVEAMYLGLPVMAFDVSYNRVTTENNALYFDSHKSLQELITSTSFKTLHNLSLTMKQIALRKYTWTIVASKYDELFEQVLSLDYKKSINSGLSRMNLSTLLKHNLGHLKHHHLFYE